jgi:hypothetical protein
MTKLRPSPTISATKNNIGTIKRGNDGHRYIVKKSVVGIKRWVRYNKVSKSKSKKGSKRKSAKKGSKRKSAKKGSKRKSAKKGSKRKSAKKGSKRKSAKKGSKKVSKRKSAKKGSKKVTKRGFVKKGSKKKSKKGSKKGFKRKSKKTSKGKANFKESLKKKGPKESSKKYSYGTIKTGQDGKKYQVVGHLNNYGNLINKHWNKISNQKGRGTDWMDIDCPSGHSQNKFTGKCQENCSRGFIMNKYGECQEKCARGFIMNKYGVCEENCPNGYTFNPEIGYCSEIRANPLTGRLLVPHSKIDIDDKYMSVDIENGRVYNHKTGRYEKIVKNMHTKRLNRIS